MINRLVLFSLLALSFSHVFPETSTRFSIVEHREENEVVIIYDKNGVKENEQHFNYGYPSDKLYKIFPNGSIIGFFAQKNPAVILKPVNNLNYPYDLVFCNILTGKIEKLTTSNGFDFHIIDSLLDDKKWIVVSPKGEASLFDITQEGIIGDIIKFPTTFYCDYVEIKYINQDTLQLALGSLGEEALYKIDLVSKKAILLNKKQVIEH